MVQRFKPHAYNKKFNSIAMSDVTLTPYWYRSTYAHDPSRIFFWSFLATLFLLKDTLTVYMSGCNAAVVYSKSQLRHTVPTREAYTQLHNDSDLCDNSMLHTLSALEPQCSVSSLAAGYTLRCQLNSEKNDAYFCSACKKVQLQRVEW